MGHYAFLDENNVVVEVITGRDENEVIDGVSDWEAYYEEVRGLKCKRTSYNTYGNTHKTGGIPFRKNYAGIGMVYDESLDAFLFPKPYPSWILNTETGLWESSIPQPDSGDWRWDEESLSWIEQG